jgi:hypothetical protein
MCLIIQFYINHKWTDTITKLCLNPFSNFMIVNN